MKEAQREALFRLLLHRLCLPPPSPSGLQDRDWCLRFSHEPLSIHVLERLPLVDAQWPTLHRLLRGGVEAYYAADEHEAEVARLAKARRYLAKHGRGGDGGDDVSSSGDDDDDPFAYKDHLVNGVGFGYRRCVARLVKALGGVPGGGPVLKVGPMSISPPIQGAPASVSLSLPPLPLGTSSSVPPSRWTSRHSRPWSSASRPSCSSSRRTPRARAARAAEVWAEGAVLAGAPTGGCRSTAPRPSAAGSAASSSCSRGRTTMTSRRGVSQSAMTPTFPPWKR